MVIVNVIVVVVVVRLRVMYAQSPYYHHPYEDCLTQTFRQIPYGPGNSTPLI